MNILTIRTKLRKWKTTFPMKMKAVSILWILGDLTYFRLFKTQLWLMEVEILACLWSNWETMPLKLLGKMESLGNGVLPLLWQVLTSNGPFNDPTLIITIVIQLISFESYFFHQGCEEVRFCTFCIVSDSFDFRESSFPQYFSQLSFLSVVVGVQCHISYFFEM